MEINPIIYYQNINASIPGNLANQYLLKTENQYNNHQNYNFNINNEKMVYAKIKKDKSSDNLLRNHNFGYIQNNDGNNNDINIIKPYISFDKADKLYYSKKEYSILNNFYQKEKDENKKLKEIIKKYKEQLFYAQKQNSQAIEQINELIKEIKDAKNKYKDNNELAIQQLNSQIENLKQNNYEKEKEINNYGFYRK